MISVPHLCRHTSSAARLAPTSPPHHTVAHEHMWHPCTTHRASKPHCTICLVGCKSGTTARHLHVNPIQCSLLHSQTPGPFNDVTPSPPGMGIPYCKVCHQQLVSPTVVNHTQQISPTWPAVSAAGTYTTLTASAQNASLWLGGDTSSCLPQKKNNTHARPRCSV